MEESFLFETWKYISFDDNILDTRNYKISSYGRVKRFDVNNKEEGTLIKLHFIGGYRRMSVIQKLSGKGTGRYIHRLVAETFIPKDNDEQKFVIHLDYNKKNNKINNLSWATKEEKEFHQFKNTKYSKHRKISRKVKLDESKVKLIKTILFDKNRKIRMKMLAKRFGVSEMQLYRIKSGENWGHVKVD